MAPSGKDVESSNVTNNRKVFQKPPRLPMDSIKRSTCDISMELSVEAITDHMKLPTISEVEDAKCECCGMCEECTPEYVSRVREKFSGKLICGLCSEAVKEEMEKNGGKIEEALSEHMGACVKFNRFGRANPVLYQVEAMKEMLKKSSRTKSLSPRDRKAYLTGNASGRLSRSSSCIPAITKGD